MWLIYHCHLVLKYHRHCLWLASQAHDKGYCRLNRPNKKGFQHVATLSFPAVNLCIAWIGIFESKEESDAVPSDPTSKEAAEFLATCKHQTLIALKEAIGADKILYGEPWIASNDPRYEANPDWDWYKEDSPITFFQDDSRNAYKGPVFELNDKKKDRGWAGGKFDERTTVMKGLSSQLNDDKTPLSGITYLDIHDNFALADQFGTKNFDGRFGVDEDRYKIATTLLYTTLGPLVTHGGTEMMRSKGFAPLREEKRVTKAGFSAYMHGKRDTYNHRIANQFVWENVGNGRFERLCS